MYVTSRQTLPTLFARRSTCPQAPAAPLAEDQMRWSPVAVPTTLPPPVKSPGHAPQPALLGSLQVNGAAESSVTPGEPALLEFGFTDPVTGDAVSGFENDHGKPMHALIVSRDLARFAHTHPALTCDGRFRLGINQPTSDPDNQDAHRAVSQGGPYMIFTEVKPENQALVQNRFALQAKGDSQPVELVADPVQGDGSVQKYFQADGTPGVYGAAYRATLKIEPMQHGSHKMLDLAVRLEQAHEMHPGHSHYMGVENVQPWLGMAGHGVLLSGAGGLTEKTFRHLHAGSHEQHEPAPSSLNPVVLPMEGEHPPHPHPPAEGAGPEFRFSMMGEEVPPPGLYKLWTQVKHQDRILTLPFVFQLG